MSIKCGHCKGRHETFPEVRECSVRHRTPSDAANALVATVAAALTGPPAQACGRRPHPVFGHEDTCRYVGTPAQMAQEAPLEPGLYHAGPKVYRLAEDRSWALLSSSGRWMEGAAAPYRPARMTVEEVAALGRRHVRCIVCGVRLKKAESVAAGIGPVCATRV